jgi:hypothetical protein
LRVSRPLPPALGGEKLRAQALGWGAKG